MAPPRAQLREIGMYGVSVKRLNEQVRRNPTRFAADLSFQLTREEYDANFRVAFDAIRELMVPQ